MKLVPLVSSFIVKTRIVLVFAFAISLVSPLAFSVTKKFSDYWYAGTAEISSYDLQQARYGELHEGSAVLVYVTEPFSKAKQVKLDDEHKAGDDALSVLKLNATRKFLTGIYPYSMMSSIFQPVEQQQYPHMIKQTTSSQEWCGHTFMQFNQTDKGYKLQGFSYFETEGDSVEKIEDVYLEDEVWTQIRLNPNALPVGKTRMLPSAFYLRLRHVPYESQSVTASLNNVASSDFSNVPHSKYSLEYKDRKLDIYFESAFPHVILGWDDAHTSGFNFAGHKAKVLTTRATRKATINEPYWGQHLNEHRVIRERLGL